LSRERRRTKRFRADLPARFRIVPPSHPADASPFQSAHVQDLSEGGVRILTDTVRVEGLHILHPLVATSEQCLLEIEIPHDDPPLTVRGKVVWYDRAGEDTPFSFQAGVQFVDLSPDRKQEIRSLLQRLKTEV